MTADNQWFLSVFMVNKSVKSVAEWGAARAFNG
jgi:hypothetical protein